MLAGGISSKGKSCDALPTTELANRADSVGTDATFLFTISTKAEPARVTYTNSSNVSLTLVFKSLRYKHESAGASWTSWTSREKERHARRIKTCIIFNSVIVLT